MSVEFCFFSCAEEEALERARRSTLPISLEGDGNSSTFGGGSNSSPSTGSASPAQAMTERERNRIREQERRRREAVSLHTAHSHMTLMIINYFSLSLLTPTQQAGQIDMNRQSDIMASFEFENNV